MKYGIIGHSGRMGGEISSLFGRRGHKLVLTMDEEGEESSDAPEVVLDFSRPEALISTIRICRKHGAPLVLGTTGLTERETDAVRELAAHVPVVHSSNFGVGINILGMILADYASVLGDWEMEMEEMHHNKKADAPSGTALWLMASAGRRCPAHSVRLGNLPGDHTVYFANGDEMLSFSHRVINRSVLAVGALRAAEFALGAKTGHYNFQDVLKSMKKPE
jgi:4-hydroxy-tetrahydrodipicolinate reductase